MMQNIPARAQEAMDSGCLGLWGPGIPGVGNTMEEVRGPVVGLTTEPRGEELSASRACPASSSTSGTQEGVTGHLCMPSCEPY